MFIGARALCGLVVRIFFAARGDDEQQTHKGGEQKAGKKVAPKAYTRIHAQQPDKQAQNKYDSYHLHGGPPLLPDSAATVGLQQ